MPEKGKKSLTVDVDLHKEVDVASSMTEIPIYVLARKAWDFYKAAHDISAPGAPPKDSPESPQITRLIGEISRDNRHHGAMYALAYLLAKDPNQKRHAKGIARYVVTLAEKCARTHGEELEFATSGPAERRGGVHITGPEPPRDDRLVTGRKRGTGKAD